MSNDRFCNNFYLRIKPWFEIKFFFYISYVIIFRLILYEEDGGLKGIREY